MDDENLNHLPEGIGIMNLYADSDSDYWYCMAIEDQVSLGVAAIQLRNELYKLYMLHLNTEKYS